MSPTWNGIHRHFVRVLSSLSFRRGFDLLQQKHTALSRFTDPVALLDALHRRSETSEQKNVILRALVEAAQSDSPVADAALTIMVLALWPGLDAIRRRSIWRRTGAADEVASDILARVVEAVRGLDPGRVHRVAATILMNIERDRGRDQVREVRRQDLRVDLDVDQIVGSSREPSIPMGLLKRDLARLVGGDTALVLRVAVDGFSQREVAAELGLSEAAGRKRYQRAVHRLRENYSDPVSRSAFPSGFSLAGAMAPPRATEGAAQMASTDDTNDLARMPGLFRRWEFSAVLETRRTYRLEEAGAHADGTPLVAIYTTPAAEQTDDSGANSDAATNPRDR